jgi:hypothetical protein
MPTLFKVQNGLEIQQKATARIELIEGLFAQEQ